MTKIIRENTKITDEQINQVGLKILKDIAVKKEETKKEEYKQQIVSFELKEIDVNMQYSKTFDSVCHSWFIVKELGMEINCKTPLVQRS